MDLATLDGRAVSPTGPRAARPTKLGRIQRAILVAAAIIVPSIVAIQGVVDLNELTSLASDGQVVQKPITDKSKIKGSHYFHYDFDAYGQSVRGRAAVPQGAYDATQIGAPVEFTVLPSDARVHRQGTVDQERIERARRSWWISGLAIFTALSIIALILQAVIQRDMRVLRTFQAVPGEIVSAKDAWNTHLIQHVVFQFKSGDAEVRGRARLQLALLETFPKDKPIVVLLDPDGLMSPQLLATIQYAELVS